MCGIVGIAAKTSRGFWSQQESAFEELLYADAVRGMDSTGVFQVTRKNQIAIVKQAVNPGVFLATGAWTTFKKDILSRGKILVGHNRKATSGNINSKNAHPFMDKGIVLVHNGYIQNSKSLDSTKEVDSETIITVLNSGKEPVAALSELLGAYAIVWYNHNTKKLYMARNKERPLCIAHTDDHMYWASEKPMLDWVLQRNSVYDAKLEVLPENQLLEISFEPFTINGKEIKPKVWSSATPGGFPHRHRQAFEDCFVPEFDVDPEGSEAPLTELGRAKRLAEAAALESQLNGIAKEIDDLKQIYPYGSKVFFYPTGCVSDKDGVDVRGRAWRPGGPAISGLISIPKEIDDELYMSPAMHLIATVDCISRRNKTVTLILKDLKLPENKLKTLNGFRLGTEEWKDICDQLLCDSCAKAPNRLAAEASYVSFTPPAEYTINCATCCAHGGPSGG